MMTYIYSFIQKKLNKFITFLEYTEYYKKVIM